jgi:hypothetical protein
MALSFAAQIGVVRWQKESKRWGGRPPTASMCQGSGVVIPYRGRRPWKRLPCRAGPGQTRIPGSCGQAGRHSPSSEEAAAIEGAAVLCQFAQVRRGDGGLQRSSLGREIGALGHEVRLIAPAYVKPFCQTPKNDAADAEAIAEAASRATMRFVPVKSAAKQGACMVFKARDLMVRQRTQTVNALRGHLAEYGVIAPQGLAHLGRLVTAMDDAKANSRQWSSLYAPC